MRPDQMPVGVIEITNGHVAITSSVNNQRTIDGRHYCDIESFSEAELWAQALAAQDRSPRIPVDRGESTYPRFDVCAPPAVGDLVSYGYNGDFYPCGEVVRISKTYYAITTSTKHVFRRRKKTSAWTLPGGGWSLVAGHRKEMNPHL